MSRPALRRKDGQVSVLVAVCIGLVMVVAAFGIDIAHVLVQKRHVQNAADAASLAASNYLPASGSCDSSCQSAVHDHAEEYANYNLEQPSQQVTLHACVDTDPDPKIQTDNDCFQTPYLKQCAAIPPVPSDPCNQLVQVRIREHVHLWFAGAVPGLAGSIKWVNAKAVGGAHPETSTTTTPGGIVVSTDPDTIVVSTSPDVVTTTTTPGGVTTTTTPGGVSTTTTPGGTHTTTIPGQTHTTTIPGATHTTTTPGQPGSGEAFAMARRCDAILYTGDGGGSIGAIGTNGGLSFQGNKPKRVDTLAYNRVGCPNNPASPPSGTSSCNGTANIYCVRTLIDLNNNVVPLNWPLPPPPLPTPRTGTWDPANDYGVNCINLGAIPPTIDSTWASSHAPGVYCSTGTATLTITASNLASGAGYTFFTLGGGQIIRNSNSTNLVFYWPSGCGSRPTSRLTSFTCFGRTINYDSDTVLYSTSTAFDPNICANNAICLAGSGNTIQGDGFAPNSATSPAYPPTPTQIGGGVFIAGGGASAGKGFFEAWEFTVQGHDGLYSGDGPGTGPQVITITDPDTVNVSTDADTLSTSTDTGSTVTTTTPGSTVTTTTPGGTTTSTTPGTTQVVTVIPGGTNTTTTPGSTQTQTTGTTVALNE
jgi:Putative Flp pilus-assembly TadE/G-like